MGTAIAPSGTVSVLGGVARGQRDAFARAADQFGPIVWSIARTYCRRSADAEDAAQEAFVKLWRVAHKYDGTRGSETAFVAAVARSAVLDFRRSQRRHEGACELQEFDATGEPTGVSPAHVGAGEGSSPESQRAAAAMATLSAEQAEALRLTVQRGLTQEAAAKVLNVPLGTIKTRVRNGLIRLREALASDPMLSAGGGA